MPILTLSHITKSFASPISSIRGNPAHNGRVYALRDVSLDVEDGECVLVTGSCGSGKSVLMRIASGLLRADSGEARIMHNGQAAKAGIVFQDADTQILGQTPLEDVMFSLQGVPRSSREEAAMKALSCVALENKAMQDARSLSGGEKRALAIASVIALDRPLVILDEPYANLDYPSVLRVNSLITHLLQAKRTVIILTHETEKALPLVRRMVILHQGVKVYDGGIHSRPRGEALEQWGIKEPTTPWL